MLLLSFSMSMSIDSGKLTQKLSPYVMISKEKFTQKLSIRVFVSWPLKKKKGRKSLR